MKVTYKNSRLEPVYERTYGLSEYTDMLREDLLRIITDVEDMAYELNDNQSKDQWSDETWNRFSRIKHKLLDKAGDIGRLPETLHVGDVAYMQKGTPLNNAVAEVLNRVP